MSHPIDIAVVGTTGIVGGALVELLEEREFPVGKLYLLASEASAGQSLPFRGRNLRVGSVADFDFAQVRLVFFAASEEVTRQYAPRALDAGCSLIDLAGGLSPVQAPRVVAEANAHLLDAMQAPYLLTSPDSLATALAVVLAPLRSLLDWQRLCVMACLPVSSLGREGVAELARQTAELLNARPLEPRFFDRQVAFNLLGQAGAVGPDGHAALERRLVDDLRQVLNAPDAKISASCVLAPVFYGDSLSVTLQASRPADLPAVRAALESAAGVELLENDDYPTVIGDAVGQDRIYVGRLRSGLDDPAELNLWIVSDNVRKGAALNAVQLAELLIKQGL